MKLTHQQVLHFRRNGYLRINRAASPEQITRLYGRAQQLFARAEPPCRISSDGAVERISAVWDRDDAVRAFFASPAVLDPMESLLGPNIVLLKNRHNHLTANAPGMNKERLHRDTLQWSRGVVTVILYLENATSENGCTRVLPGSQFLPYVGEPNNGGTWMDEHELYQNLLDQSVELPIPAGGILILDSVCFHTAGANVTDRSRISVTMAYHSVDELCPAPAPANEVLVRGQFLYRGNDRAADG